MQLPRSNTNVTYLNNEGQQVDANVYLQRAVKVMKQLTQAEKSLKSVQNQIKVKKLSQINQNLELAGRKDPACMNLLVEAKIITYIAHFFRQSITKAPALIFLRLLVPAMLNSQIYLNQNIPLLVAKVLTKEQNRSRSAQWEEEISQALKLTAVWLEHLPEDFPRLLATSLVCLAELPAYTEFQQRKKDHLPLHLKTLAIEAVLLMTNKRITLAIESGAFSLLISAVTDPLLQQQSSAIVMECLCLLNEHQSRQILWNSIDLKKIFSVFTDMDVVFMEENSRSKGNTQFCSRLQTQLVLAKKALLTMLKSWTGLVLLGNDGNVLKSILEALKQIPRRVDSEVRKSIYSLLEEVMAVGQGLMGGTQRQHQNEYRASTLLSAYMMTLLRLLVDHGLFELLVELSGINQPVIAEPAQRLLRRLSIYLFNFLPDAAGYMDFLISASTSRGDASSLLKHSSSFIVSKIGSYIFEEGKQFTNPFLGQLEHVFHLDIYTPLNRSSVLSISKTLNFLAYKEVPFYRRKLLDQRPIPKQHKENFTKWDWNAIIDLLSFPDIDKDAQKPDSNDRYKQFKLFKYLLRFYSPSRGNFAEQKWTMDNLVYVKAGKLLIQNTLTIPDNLQLVRKPPESQFECTISFIGELQKVLEVALEKSVKSPIKCYMPFFKTLQRQLILWIGSFSSTKVGYETLICQNQFFQVIYKFLHKRECSHIIMGVLFMFDFFRDNLKKKYTEGGVDVSVLIGPRALLARAVAEGSKSLRLMMMELIKLLFRAELGGFNGEGMRLLFCLVISQEEQIWQNAIECIEFLTKDRQLLQSMLAALREWELKQPSEYKILLDRMTASILIRLVGMEEGYLWVEEKFKGWLERQYSEWMAPTASQLYFDNLEALLASTLNFSRKEERGYRIESKSKDLIEWGYLYKLPWLAYVNDAEEVPLLLKFTTESLLLYAEFIDEEYDFRSINHDNVVRVCLGVGGVYLDERFTPIRNKISVPVNLNENRLVSLYGQQYYSASNCGVTIFFTLRPQGQSRQEVSESSAYASSYDIKRIHIEVARNAFQENEELPVHLIQELTKNQKGMAFLESKEITSHAKWVLGDSSHDIQQVRSVLWSLGYYGSTAAGFSRLAEEGLVDLIIQHSHSCPTLSLRGTSRYVLNMLCHSQIGRSQISLKGMSLNPKLLSCFPKEPQHLYTLSDEPSSASQRRDKLWDDYTRSLMPLNPAESQLFQAISLLINSLSHKQAHSLIKDSLRANGRVVCSFQLLNNVVQLMSYFKLKQQARKTILLIFDEFIRSSQFQHDSYSRINYAAE